MLLSLTLFKRIDFETFAEHSKIISHKTFYYLPFSFCFSKKWRVRFIMTVLESFLPMIEFMVLAIHARIVDHKISLPTSATKKGRK